MTTRKLLPLTLLVAVLTVAGAKPLPAQVLDTIPARPTLGQQIRFRGLRGLELETESKPAGSPKTTRAFYAPGVPGWIIVSAEFERTSASSNSDSQVSLVPAESENIGKVVREGSSDLLYKTDFALLEKFGIKIDAHRRVQEYAAYHSEIRINAQTAFVDLNVNPKGPFQGRSWIEGNLVVDMIYVGTKADFEAALEEARNLNELAKEKERAESGGSPGDPPLTDAPKVAPHELAGEWRGSNGVKYVLTATSDTTLGLPIWNWKGKKLLYKSHGRLTTDGETVHSEDSKSGQTYIGTISSDRRTIYFPDIQLTLTKK